MRNSRKDETNIEMLELLKQMNQNIEKLGDNMRNVQTNTFRASTPRLPSIPRGRGGSDGPITGLANKASKKISSNKVTDFAASLVKLQKSIEDAASMIGGILTDDFNLKQRFGASKTAQAQTSSYASALAAQGYQMSDSEIADNYLQFREIEERKLNAQRRVKYLTTRGTAFFGKIPGAAKFGVQAEDWMQEAYNSLFYRSEDSLNNELRSLVKTQDQAKMQKEINKNNKVHDSGGY